MKQNNKELTIKETFQIKHHLEKNIFEAIKRFEQDTGLLVEDIVYKSSRDDEDEDLEPDKIELVTLLNNDYYEDQLKKG